MLKRSVLLQLLLCLIMTGTAMAAETVRQREQREAYQKQLSLRLQEINQKLASLKTTGLKDDVRREFGRLQEELRMKQEAAAKKLSEAGSATGQDWERLKYQVHAAIQDLDALYERMSSLLRRT
ncbi:MAG: hypothetical protein A2010_16505 [Nitrospirae bacterium GWD2_57_9]|nr:MAG: hypothetical protein A2010_16505 [Nitrospirae bacterium GWD2_57_9]OGW48449.1 MAG: hypothetical protein A2078_09985 [Nitrospirae bacterium GWC2_57_9]